MSALTYRGIISFPKIFRAEATSNDPTGKKKFGISILFPPGDPELAKAKLEFEKAKLEGFPAGAPSSAKFCLQKYGDKFRGKEYYDPKLEEWWVLSANSNEDSRPTIVTSDYSPVIDPASELFVPGAICLVNLGMYYYNKSGGIGIAGGLNGVMGTGEMGSLGRLDNKPSAEQMFGGGGAAPQAQGPAGPGPSAPGPSAPGPDAPTPPGKVMTAAAEYTYEQYITAGWDDEKLIAKGLLQA